MTGEPNRLRASRPPAPSAVVETVAHWAEHLETALDARRVAADFLPVLAASVGAMRGSLMLVDSGTGRLRLVAALGLPGASVGSELPPAPRRISDWVLRESRSLIMNGELRDARFDASAPRDRISSAMSVPLAGSRGVVGVLNLARVQTTIPFTPDDLASIEAVTAAVAAIFERVIELGLARREWRRLRSAPAGAEPIDSRTTRFALSRLVGATPSHDVFEQMTGADGTQMLLLLEPFGPPVRALRASEWLRGVFQAIAPRIASVRALAGALDAMLRERRPGEAARAWLGSLSTTGQLVSCAAGWPAPFCLPSEGGAGQRLLEGGPPLGAASVPAGYDSTALRLLPGDAVLLVSDGVLDACSPAGVIWGEAGLLGHLQDHWPGPLDGLAAGLTDAARSHAGLSIPTDDLLVLIARYTRPS